LHSLCGVHVYSPPGDDGALQLGPSHPNAIGCGLAAIDIDPPQTRWPNGRKDCGGKSPPQAGLPVLLKLRSREGLACGRHHPACALTGLSSRTTHFTQVSRRRRAPPRRRARAAAGATDLRACPPGAFRARAARRTSGHPVGPHHGPQLSPKSANAAARRSDVARAPRQAALTWARTSRAP
jgi:hypothetical protein